MNESSLTICSMASFVQPYRSVISWTSCLNDSWYSGLIVLWICEEEVGLNKVSYLASSQYNVWVNDWNKILGPYDVRIPEEPTIDVVWIAAKLSVKTRLVNSVTLSSWEGAAWMSQDNISCGISSFFIASLSLINGAMSFCPAFCLLLKRETRRPTILETKLAQLTQGGDWLKLTIGGTMGIDWWTLPSFRRPRCNRYSASANRHRDLCLGLSMHTSNRHAHNLDIQSSGPTNTRFETREMIRITVGTAVTVRDSGRQKVSIEAWMCQRFRCLPPNSSLMAAKISSWTSGKRASSVRELTSWIHLN